MLVDYWLRQYFEDPKCTLTDACKCTTLGAPNEHSAAKICQKCPRIKAEVSCWTGRRAKMHEEEQLAQLLVSCLSWQLLHKRFVVSVLNLLDQIRAWGTRNVDDHLHLFCTILSGHKRLTTDHLGQYASNRPDIDCCRVLLPGKNDFRCSVPSRGNVVSQLCRWCHQ